MWLLRVSCEAESTAEAPSSQSQENFLFKNSFLGALCAAAVQFPSGTSEKSLKTRKKQRLG